MKKSILTAAVLISLVAITISAINLPLHGANLDSPLPIVGPTPKKFGVVATLVINEIDYDTVGTDNAEYLELKNVSALPINLDLYTVELVNGNAGGAAIYDTIDLPNVNLAAGDYYVICANTATVVNCDLDDGPDTDFIQNGSPDAIGLRLSGILIDAVSYEGNTGAPYTETTGAPLASADSNTIAFIGLSRFPDGGDTDNNSVDFSLRCITPGTANLSANTGCTAPVVITAAPASLGGRVITSQGQGIRNVFVSVSGGDLSVPRIVITGTFGYYRFDDLRAGETYVVTVNAKRYVFAVPSQVVNLTDNVTDMNFVALQ